MKAYLDAKCNVFTEHMEVPPEFQGEYELLCEDIYSLGDLCGEDYNKFEEQFVSTGLSERYNSLLARCKPKAVKMTREQKMEIDERRTSCHDSLIVKFNMLARYLKMQGKPAAWRDTLGHLEDDPANRKRIGDFACYLVFINSINAR